MSLYASFRSVLLTFSSTVSHLGSSSCNFWIFQKYGTSSASSSTSVAVVVDSVILQYAPSSLEIPKASMHSFTCPLILLLELSAVFFSPWSLLISLPRFSLQSSSFISRAL